MYNSRGHIRCGGSINFKDSLLEPTVIVTKLDGNVNYQEIFGPIAFIYSYDCDQSLRKYFDENKYRKNQIYVSLYGDSKYISDIDDALLIDHSGVGIVIRN